VAPEMRPEQLMAGAAAAEAGERGDAAGHTAQEQEQDAAPPPPTPTSTHTCVICFDDFEGRVRHASLN
jgi:hypothetical protein